MTPFDSISKIASAIPLIDKYNKGLDLTAKETQIFNSAIESSTFAKYVENIKDGSASLSGYIKYLIETQVQTLGATIKTKLLSAAMTALHIAANIAIVTLVSYGIEKLVEYFINLSHAQQDAINKANELTEAYNNSIQTINSNITSLQSFQDEFSTLAKGVDANGKNIGLTADQFKRYHEIVKQIVDIQPSLIQGFDDSGNAIVNNNIALDSAIQYEKQQLEIEKQKYLSNASQTLTGAQNEVQQNTNNAKQSVKELSDELGKYIISSKEYAKALNEVAISGSNQSSSDILSQLSSEKFSKELKSFRIDYQKLLNGNSEELSKFSKKQDEIISKIKQENNLTDSQASALSNIVSKISTASNAIDTSNQKIVSLVDVWSSLSQNSDWYDKISNVGALDEFNKSIDHFIQENPKASIAEIENAAKNLGTAFANEKPEIDKVNNAIADLKKQLNSGKISTDDYNKQINNQIISVEKLADSYEKTNPILAEFLNLIAQGLADNFIKQSDATNNFASILTDVDGQINKISSSINDYSSSMQTLNQAIDTLNKGDLLTGEQVAALIQKYPELTDKIQHNAYGYYFKANALETVRGEEVKEQETSINTAIADAQNTINSVLKQIEAYSSLIGAIKNVADAKRALAGLSETSSGNTRNHILLKDTLGKEDYAQVSGARKLLNNYLSVSDELDQYQDQLASLKKQASLVGQNNYEKVDNSGFDAANKAATNSANSAEDAAKKAAQALQDQYNAELKVIEANKELGKYKPDKYGVEGLQYYNALLALYNKWKNSALDSDDKLALQEKVLSAHKDYEQNILDISYKELDNRLQMGKVEENSINHLNNLLQIQKLLNSANMSLINTQENQLELQEKIYSVRKAYADNMLEESYAQLQERLDSGKVRENSAAHLQNLLEIQKLLNTGATIQPANTEENQLALQQKIYEVKKGSIQNDLDDLDTQVQLGNIQENSLAYINELYNIKQKINSLDLNAIDKANELNDIEAKILDARKSYIQQLESDLSDENIVGSYGYRIKQIQDEIDAINNKADSESKLLAVEKAKAAWEEAQSQKTISIYREDQGGFVYEADTTAINEKKEALADAEREEQIEKLTEQKDQIQSEEDDMKSQLEDVLRDMEGTNDRTWDNIQDEIYDVIDNIDKVFRTHTSKTKSYNDEINDSLDDSTENTSTDYEQQLKSANDFSKKLVPIATQIINTYNSMATAMQNATDKISAWGKALLQAERDRENANWNYYEYNQELKNNGHSVKYASGTQYSVGGLAQTDEEGYELKLQNLGNDKYTLLNEGSIVLSADATKNLWNLANNPQVAMLKAGLQNRVNVPNISNVTTHKNTISQTFPNATFEIEGAKDTFALLNQLKNIGLTADQMLTEK